MKTFKEHLETLDEVYMTSPFGIYKGIVKNITDTKITVESYSPTGRGCMLAEYDINNNDWEKIHKNK